MTNRKWVTLSLFLCPGVSLILDPWLGPTVCQWHCFIFARQSHWLCLFHDQQEVGDTALSLYQAVSSVLILWPTVCEKHCLLSLAGSLINCFIPWSWIGSEWHFFISLTASLINHVFSHKQQVVSNTVLFLYQEVSLITSHPMTNSMWVVQHYFFTRLINHVSSHHQFQPVSDTAIFLKQLVSSISSHPMTNRWWVALFYFFDWKYHKSCLFPWTTGGEWHKIIPSQPSHHVSPHDEQEVSDTLYFFGRQSHQLCLVPFPTVCEWYCFISLVGSLMNDISSCDE